MFLIEHQMLLFEHQKSSDEITNRQDLESRLNRIWSNRKAFGEDQSDEDGIEKEQRFFRFDGNNIQARNYVGFFAHEKLLIEVYPKIFEDEYKNKDDVDLNTLKSLMVKHFFYWISYCRTFNLPYDESSLAAAEIPSFPDLLIHLWAKQFHECVSTAPLNLYQDVEGELLFPKGKINFSRYLSVSIAHGNYHKLQCDYESFQYDNKVNRIIKYCTRLLLSYSKQKYSQRILEEVIFMLDEVEDVIVTSNDLSSIQLNPLYEIYNQTLHSCRLVLENLSYSSVQSETPQFSLLLPMEKIFEEYVRGFFERHYRNEWKVEAQKSDLYLARDENKKNVFNLKHDLLITSKKDNRHQVIIDTKYKSRNRSSDIAVDLNKGVAQGDMYQMLSYAYRRNVNNVLLLYPSSSVNCSEIQYFDLLTESINDQSIRIWVGEIPFYRLDHDFNSHFDKIKVSIDYLLETIFKQNSKDSNLRDEID